MSESKQSPARVLVVDDEPDFRAVLKYVLERSGYSVVTAIDGEEGLSRFRAERPDIMLLDVNMPGLDGPEVCRRVRAARDGAALPILMLTVRSEIQTAADCVRAGATDYVVKPFEEADLLRRIARALKR